MVLVHADATDLAACSRAARARPLLLAADHPASVTHAYAAMKLLAQRAGLMALRPAAGGRRQLAARASASPTQLASCADRFLGAALHDWARDRPRRASAAPRRPLRAGAACSRAQRLDAGDAARRAGRAMAPTRAATPRPRTPTN